jgi:rhamnose utilization protein RhaD (predicted bifunctional aldolase and dehydrogenase)
MDQPADLTALARASAALGEDPTIVQAAGGNTSVKVDDVLWVKASGFWLKDALTRPIFVPLSLSGVRRRIAAGEDEPARPEVIAWPGMAGLRPSIETALHALLPQRFVLHTHSVVTIAWAIRQDGERAIAPRLDGLRWGWIPYVMPGVPLTRAIDRAMAAKGALDVLILGNHGLVVAADTLDDALALHAEVEARLAVPLRATHTPDLDALAPIAATTGRRLPRHEAVHGLALDPETTALALAGPLYPDHVIFLGPRLSSWTGTRESEPEAPLLLVPGGGALVAPDLSPSGEELALCLALVLERSAPGAAVTTLPPDEVDALLQWDAEAYRKELMRRERFA